MRLVAKTLFTSLLIVVPAAMTLADGLPRAIVEEHVFHAGTVQQGPPIAHDFIIKNGGNGPLTIKAQPC
ncbi:MAG TPA: hypothetical protein PLB81_06035 [Deltaproteobacteria bacterium]|nr:hypothetical protein [Deltaproteobacteria bacterium]